MLVSRFARPLLFLSAVLACAVLGRGNAAERSAPERARYVITVTDDFIVDAYHNGKLIPDAKRTMLEEKFGATVERLDVPVHKGDWLVFNVVNNRLRWGGASYFGAAGCFAQNEFGFVSRPETEEWSACDSPRDVDRFIQDRNFLRHHAARSIPTPWSDGDSLMRAYAGDRWNGAPVWGSSRNTWLKLIVE